MSKRTRRLLLIAFPAAALALAVGVWLLWPRTAMTRANAAKIRLGMTLAEVEAILGGPARDETTGPIEYDTDSHNSIDFGLQPPIWRSDHVMIGVVFSNEGRVVNCFPVPMRRAQQHPSDVLRGLLRHLLRL